jgi:hypothetical protein
MVILSLDGLLLNNLFLLPDNKQLNKRNRGGIGQKPDQRPRGFFKQQPGIIVE